MWNLDIDALQNLGNHSWHEFVVQAAKRINGAGAKGHGDQSAEYGSEFAGTSSMREAVKMALDGWQQGAKRIADKLDVLPPSSEVLPDWNLDVAGSICNVPAFLAGEPECMWRMSECKRLERRVSIIVSGTYSGGIGSDTAQQYATAVAALVRALESDGVNPAVYLINASGGRSGYKDAAYSVAVREFGEPLDLSRIAFAFHPSFLRRIQFGWQEMSAEAIAAGLGRGTYGTVGTLTKEIANKLLGDIGHVALVPSLNDLSRKSEDEMIEILRDFTVREIKQLV